MDDFACIMVGRVLGIDPMEIIAACQEEREKNEERRGFWRDFRETLGTKIAVALTIGALAAGSPTPAQATMTTTAKQVDTLFIMSNKRRRKAAKSALLRLLQIRYTGNLQNA